MATTPYITRQEVREDAGFQHIEENAHLVGVIDGENKVFMTEHKPIVDRDHSDGAVTTADVTVYIDGSPVAIDSLDALNGVITLEDAPSHPEDSEIVLTAYYAHSQLSDTYIDRRIKQATGIVHRCLKSHGISVPFDDANEAQAEYYPTIQLIVTLYSAGLCLIRDYGSTADTEETSKDGYKKLQEARTELEELCEALLKDPLIPNAGNGKGGKVSVISKGNIFGDGFGEDRYTPPSHDKFMRKES